MFQNFCTSSMHTHTQTFGSLKFILESIIIIIMHPSVRQQLQNKIDFRIHSISFHFFSWFFLSPFFIILNSLPIFFYDKTCPACFPFYISFRLHTQTSEIEKEREIEMENTNKMHAHASMRRLFWLQF